MSKLFETFFHDLETEFQNSPLWKIEELFSKNNKDFNILKFPDKEVFEVVKNDVKTTVTVYFNHKGHPVYTRTDSASNISKEEQIKKIEEDIKLRVASKDWDIVATLVQELKELKANKK